MQHHAAFDADLIAAAKAEERERCAKIADEEVGICRRQLERAYKRMKAREVLLALGASNDPEDEVNDLKAMLATAEGIAAALRSAGEGE